MSALDTDELRDVLEDEDDPEIGELLDRADFEHGPAFSIPWAHWQLNEARGWLWWKRTFERAAKRGLRIQKIKDFDGTMLHDDQPPRTGFQFHPPHSTVGVEANWWVNRANEKLRRAGHPPYGGVAP